MSQNHEFREDLLSSNYTYRKLFDEHEQLEDKIFDVQMAPSSDSSEVSLLKRKKLMVVDQMRKIEMTH